MLRGHSSPSRHCIWPVGAQRIPALWPCLLPSPDSCSRPKSPCPGASICKMCLLHIHFLSFWLVQQGSALGNTTNGGGGWTAKVPPSQGQGAGTSQSGPNKYCYPGKCTWVPDWRSPDPSAGQAWEGLGWLLSHNFPTSRHACCLGFPPPSPHSSGVCLLVFTSPGPTSGGSGTPVIIRRQPAGTV